MITKLLLVRHAETVGNVEKRLTGRADYKITKKGKETIEKLTKRFQNIHIDLIFSSSSNRSFETVKQISYSKKIDIIQNDKLCEMFFGIYDGLKWEEVKFINPNIITMHIKTNEIIGIPEQETTEAVANRMYNYIKDISKKNAGKTILVASHGVAIEAFLRKVTRIPFYEKKEEYSQKNTSVNELEYDDIKETFKLLVINNTDHLL